MPDKPKPPKTREPRLAPGAAYNPDMFRYDPANPWTRGIARLEGKRVAQEDLEAQRAAAARAARQRSAADVWLVVHQAVDGTPLRLEST